MIDINELLLRCCAIEIEALAALTTPVSADATHTFFYTQEDYPYFTHRVAGITLDEGVSDYGEEFDSFVVDVTIRMIIGFATEGYIGDIDTTLYSYISQVMNYYQTHELLQSAAYATAQTDLVRARIVANRGLLLIESAGVAGRLVGTEYTLRAEFESETDQAYL
jgi:hypothetical protein